MAATCSAYPTRRPTGPATMANVFFFLSATSLRQNTNTNALGAGGDPQGRDIQDHMGQHHLQRSIHLRMQWSVL